MRIAFYVYPVAFQTPGGGEIALLKTKEYLEKEGVQVTLFNPWKDKLSSFDILHTFGSVKDSLQMMEAAKRVGVKNVLSTICWYSFKSSWLMHLAWRERMGPVSRHLLKIFFPYVPSQRKRMMQISDAVIPNSRSEAKQLRRFFNVPSGKITVIHNGTDQTFADANPDEFYVRYGLSDFVLCVGRIEPRKNQLNVIKALKGIHKPVVFIGDYVSQFKSYYELCKREADKNMHFLGPLPHDSSLLASSYAACNTFLLATWLETPGLAALEAALAGAKVVITDQGATKEYFSDLVTYVKPHKPDEIRKKLVIALDAQKNTSLKEYIKKKFLWSSAAKKMIKVYEGLLREAPSKKDSDFKRIKEGVMSY